MQLTILLPVPIFNPMVDQLDIVFRALADPTRRSMISTLARGPRTVGELAAPFEISLAAASKHIQVLERAGLIRRTVKGRTHTVRLEAAPLRAGVEWMRRYEQFWTERLDALERELLADDARATPARQSSAPPAPSSSADSATSTALRSVATSRTSETSETSETSAASAAPAVSAVSAVPATSAAPVTPAAPSPRGPRLVPPHERPSRRSTRRKGS